MTKQKLTHMKQQRLDGLADGIFAIVMTFLAFEIKVPVMPDFVDEATLFMALKDLLPILLSFLMSFALLFTYWRAHHYITSVYSKTLTVYLACYNALFFLL
ncbi:MAG: TMEM175 family protein, partial [bacterium]